VSATFRQITGAFRCLLGLWLVPLLHAGPVRVVGVEGVVTWSREGAVQWEPAGTNRILLPGDRLRTGPDSRAAVQFSDQSVKRLGELTTLTIAAPPGDGKAAFEMQQGKLFFRSWEQPNQIRFKTRTVSGAIRGTEFSLEVAEDGRTVLTLFNGAVDLENSAGQLRLQSGEEATVESGQAPRKAPAINTQKIIQWCLYYPGVLDVDELDLPDSSIALSVAAYRAGDLHAALAAWPTLREPRGAAEQIYRAALALSVGQVPEAERTLAVLPMTEDRHQRVAAALRQVIAAVQFEKRAALALPATATEWLAESYSEQSQSRLEAALAAARRAVELNPKFGFAQARVAELEFSFGRTAAAQAALSRALDLSPRHGQAIALSGFLLAAVGSHVEAEAAFSKAIEVDSALANAWLGRGLMKIRRGDRVGGRADLQVAATLEPNRALLRSYLGKSFQHFGDRTLAAKELGLAKQLDRGDPTAWLYSALLNHQQDRIAAAIRDLEESARLNDNRAVYRSRLLLDQDRAVRSANLANIYESAGMREVSLRESARSVMFDYANYSAHLNLASSFNALRDPTRFSLRNETEWSSESLIASLLAPPGAAVISQNYSQNEYARAFAQPRIGLNSTTEYFSDAREIRQSASQFGHTDGTAYAFDLDYGYKRGNRINNELSRIEWYSTVKQQLTAEDSLLIRVKYQDYESGDNFQRLNPATARPNLRFTEAQEPILLVGYHHEWAPGAHTLALGGRFINDQRFSDPASPQLMAVTAPAGAFDPFTANFDLSYRSSFEVWSGEVQHILQRERHTDIFGARFQRGEFNASSRQDNVSGIPAFGGTFLTQGNGDMERMTLYAYHNWEISDDLLLTCGVAHDRLTWPENFRRSPLASGEAGKHRWLPKVALIYNPQPAFVARMAVARALGGVSYDESIRLEPTQLAGFSQSFRTLVSESLAGSVEAPTYDILGAGLDLRFPTGTYITAEAGERRQRIDRLIGIMNFDAFLATTTPGSTVESLRFRERTAVLTVNQVLGENVFLEGQYRLTDSRLMQDRPSIPATAGYARATVSSASLHQWRVALFLARPEGLFTRAEFAWWDQNGRGFLSGVSDAFPQVDVLAGWHFRNRRGDLSVGLLNVTGEDYRLSPINHYTEIPRQRTLYTRFRLNF
jgi:Flp pilus assembly protein TadD